jgi:hypothetical protein
VELGIEDAATKILSVRVGAKLESVSRSSSSSYSVVDLVSFVVPANLAVRCALKL